MKVLLAAFLTLAAALVYAAPAVAADEYPTRTIRWIVPYPPGGTTDILARIMGQRLSERLGQQVLIDNRPGAGNNIGTELAIKSTPDGYTVFLVNPANAINATLYSNLAFNFLRDMDPVAGLVRVPNVMEVTMSLPVKSIPEFIAHVKANPGKVILASSGAGTSVHLSGELFMSMTGLKMTHVPYSGSVPALTALMGNQVQTMFDAPLSSNPHIQSGKLRALAVTGNKGLALLPNIPTIAASGYPGYEAGVWFALVVPKATPAAIVARLNLEVTKILSEPLMKARFDGLALELIPGPADEVSKYAALEQTRWSRLIREKGIRLEP